MDESIRVLYVGETGEGTAGAALERTDPTLAVETVPPDAVTDELDGVDCLVTGSALSGTDDVDVLGAVRREQPDLPVVLSTGHGDEGRLAERVRAAVGAPPAGPTQQAHTRLHAETFPDLAFYIDERGKYVDVLAGRGNPLLYDEPEELLGQALQDVLPADTARHLQAAVDSALRTGEVQTVQYQLDVQAGSRWFEGRIAPAERPHADREQVLLVVRDITGRKERETALEALHEMATTIQTAGTVEEACELTVTAAADILEFEMCSVIIREGDWLVPYAVSEQARPNGARRMHIDEGLAGKTARTGESYVIDRVEPDDETEPALASIESGLSVPLGEQGVFQAVSTEPEAFDEGDITLAELLVSHTTTAIDRIEREQDLTRKTDRLEEFASFVSHDLRNPLNVAMLRLELLAEEHDSEHLGELENALDRMERLIDELLALARQGDTIGDTEPVRLADVVNRAWLNVETTDATLDCRTDLTVYADPTRLTAVLENLVRNSVEHGFRTPRSDAREESVTVTVGDLADGTGFYVADDGPGIPEEHRERIFESGYSTAPDGTGFGLTIVSDIVEAHDWEVSVGESADGGARFEITGVEVAQ